MNELAPLLCLAVSVGIMFGSFRSREYRREGQLFAIWLALIAILLKV